MTLTMNGRLALSLDGSPPRPLNVSIKAEVDLADLMERGLMRMPDERRVQVELRGMTLNLELDAEYVLQAVRRELLSGFRA